MAEHGIGESIAAGLATCLAFLGALGAALKFWNWEPEPKGPEKGDDMGARMASLETWRDESKRRHDHADEQIEKIYSLLGKVDEGLGKCQTDVREALTRLEERRAKG